MTGSALRARPRVSIALITYQQERTIAQAIDSVLAQATSFDIELVIGEDASTDRTREIVVDYATRFPSRVRLVLQEANRGLLRNFIDTFTSCRGDYVALLDGDDYWLNRDKLERQVAFLDSHPECSICCHAAAMLRSGETIAEDRYPEPDWKTISTIEDLFRQNFIPTCSAMVRRDAIATLPGWFESCPWEDWPLFLLYAERGKIGYLADVMAVYRMHSAGLWSGLRPGEQVRRKIAFLIAMDERFGHRYHALIRDQIATHQTELDKLVPATGDSSPR